MSKSVLLLDENPDVLSFLTHLLDARGVRVLRARTKCEAFEILGRDYVSVDLVLANVMIAEIDQGCLVREVASTRRGISSYVHVGIRRLRGHSRRSDVPRRYARLFGARRARGDRGCFVGSQEQRHAGARRVNRISPPEHPRWPYSRHVRSYR